MILRAFAILLLLTGAAFGQAAQPTGTFTPGHALQATTPTGTPYADAGGSAGSTTFGRGYLTELGITNTGAPFCITDALITSLSGYHQLCLGANALGGALLSYNAIGGASPLPLQCEINGSLTSCLTGSVDSITFNNGLTATPNPIILSGTAGLAPIGSHTVLGNVTGGAAVPIALSKTQLTTLINPFTSSLSGAVPASGGGTTQFLRADATFAVPPGSVSVTAATPDLVINPSPGTGTFTVGSTQPLNDQSGGGYAILTGDGATNILAGAYTYTLPQAGTTGFPSGWGTCVLNIGSGSATLTTTTSVFAGAGGGSSLTIPQNGWACPTSNATDYDTIVGGYGGITGSGTANILPKFTTSTVVGNSSYSDNGTGVVTVDLNNTGGQDFSGAGLVVSGPGHSGLLGLTIGSRSASTSTAFTEMNSFASADANFNTLAAAAGTGASPTALGAGNRMAAYSYDAYTGSVWTQGALIRVIKGTNAASTDAGTTYYVNVATDGNVGGVTSNDMLFEMASTGEMDWLAGTAHGTAVSGQATTITAQKGSALGTAAGGAAALNGGAGGATAGAGADAIVAGGAAGGGASAGGGVQLNLAAGAGGGAHGQLKVSGLPSSDSSVSNSIWGNSGALMQTGFAMAGTLSSVAAPTGTTDTGGKMMGLAGTITPGASGKVLITVSGDIANSASGDGANVQLRRGTGSAPSNADALTGTTCGSLHKYIAAANAQKVPFSITCLVTGLAKSTAVWIDVGLAAVTGGTASIADVDIVAQEVL